MLAPALWIAGGIVFPIWQHMELGEAMFAAWFSFTVSNTMFGVLAATISFFLRGEQRLHRLFAAQFPITDHRPGGGKQLLPDRRLFDQAHAQADRRPEDACKEDEDKAALMADGRGLAERCVGHRAGGRCVCMGSG